MNPELTFVTHGLSSVLSATLVMAPGFIGNQFETISRILRNSAAAFDRTRNEPAIDVERINVVLIHLVVMRKPLRYGAARSVLVQARAHGESDR